MTFSPPKKLVFRLETKPGPLLGPTDANPRNIFSDAGKVYMYAQYIYKYYMRFLWF